MKQFLIGLTLAAGILACGKKIVPETGAQYRSGEKPAGTVSSSSATNTNAAMNNGNMNQRVIPDGSKPVSLDAGKTVYVTKCGNCHALKTPGDYTVDQTYAYLKKEIPRAKLDRKEGEELTAYLVATAKR